MKVNDYKYKYRGTDRFGRKWDEYYDRVSGEYIEPTIDFDTLVNKVLQNCNEHKHWELLKGQYVVENTIRTVIGFELITVLNKDGKELEDTLDYNDILDLCDKVAVSVEHQPEEMEDEKLYDKLIAEEKKKLRDPHTFYLGDAIHDEDLDEEDSTFMDSLFESILKDTFEK